MPCPRKQQLDHGWDGPGAHVSGLPVLRAPSMLNQVSWIRSSATHTCAQVVQSLVKSRRGKGMLPMTSEFGKLLRNLSRYAWCGEGSERSGFREEKQEVDMN